MKKTYILLGAIVVIVIVIFAGFFVWQNFLVKENHPVILPDAPSDEWANFETFKDEYGFQMQYPSDKKVMNVPTSRMVVCNNSCPTTLQVNGIESAYANQTINGVEYCIYSGAKTTAGIFYNDYFFLTVKNNNCYGLDVSFQGDTNMALISQALSTIKFVK